MERITITSTPERLALIDRAAAICGVSRTEFMLQASEAAAIETLNAAPVITLDDQAYEDFTAALEAPDKPSAHLRRLAAHRPLWES